MQKWTLSLGIILAFGFVLGISPAISAQGMDRDLETRVAALWKAHSTTWLKTPPLQPSAVPPIDSATGFWTCMTHRVVLEPVRVSGDNRSFTNVLVCTKGRHLWCVSSTGPSDPLVWRGSFQTESAAEPAGQEASGPAPKKNEVLRALYEHFTDSGQQGFYHDRFGNLRRWGKQIVGVLKEIYETDQDPQIRMLALEALGEFGSRELLPTLRQWLQNPGRSGNDKLGVAIVMAQLGDRTVIDRAIGQWKQGVEQAIGNGDKKSASATHAQIALVYSRLGEGDVSLVHYLKAIELDAENSNAHYNLACAYAKAGKKDEAFDSLQRSIKSGFKNFEWIRVDGDLKPLHEDPRWKKLLQGR